MDAHIMSGISGLVNCILGNEDGMPRATTLEGVRSRGYDNQRSGSKPAIASHLSGDYFTCRGGRRERVGALVPSCGVKQRSNIGSREFPDQADRFRQRPFLARLVVS